ncbi:head-tail connector protein [Pasteurella multocida]|uniref:head-tail connector protein n=1 Tax=Pasteurella multocida TaxID=747 RepID=UPI0023014D77|nr:head-tail connector protein [Pasteurella multocida]MDA5608970.1 head-tail connector protein [Pasteurella multocida subsp. multocida]MDA5616491.1 head-tail connector protein [Pasteurella multocida]MDA5626510.1 head-tail connector protein [Pasteurella multocida]
MVDINNLIDLQEIKAHLNLADEFDLDDELLSIYAVTALEVAQRHIGKTFGNEETDKTIPFNHAIKVGCLMYIAHLYTNREVTTDSEQTIIPMTIKSLWDVYREPCVY